METESLYIKWLDFKRKFYGLTPLEQYIAENHDDGKDANPFATYLYFVTYEREVLERKYIAEQRAAITSKREEELTAEERLWRTDYPNDSVENAYQQSILAVRDHSLENTTYKASIHFFSIFMVGMLMLSASAVSTYKVMDFFGDSFGHYTYLVQGFMFATATWAQWMIYGRTAPDTLKKLFYLWGNEGWHFTKYRVLRIKNDGKLENTKKQLPYNRWAFAAFCLCSALLAFSLGMILLHTASAPASEGNVFVEMAVMHQVVEGMGGLQAVSSALFLVYFLCNFALYVSSSLEYLFKKSEESLSNEQNAQQKKSTGFLGIQWTKTLIALCFVNLIGLVGTILSQTTSTFNYISDRRPGNEILSLEEGSDTPWWIMYLCLPAYTFIAVMGRVLFNVKAMENLEALIKESWACRADLWNTFKQDVRDNAVSYAIGVTGTVTSITMFGLMGGFGDSLGKTGINALRADASLSSLLPLVLTISISVAVWAGYKTYARYQRETANVDDTASVADDPETNSLPGAPSPTHTERLFTVQRHSVGRGKFALMAIAGNAVGAGGIAVSSTDALQMYDRNNTWIKPCATCPLELGGGLMSTGSALAKYNVVRNDPKKR